MKVDLMSEIQIGTPPAGAAKAVERPASGNTAGAGKAASTSGTSSAGRGTATPSSMTVTLSQQSQALSGSSDVIDMDKVQSMRTAIENGTFKVNPEAIADKLLSNAKEMLTASRR